ncbi:L,D-transpeptidase [Saccharothrix longispora]|uniref:L,D-transpeptidase n=1 Tax=Saccharothrix longispora TaxID=33920 RepID=UPI0028FD96C7|nr:L,D-transpeptidase [Saccharothrix longispora]MDU0294815.1 L,D-transpeptidase [Saccharothrix longispora]
MRHGRTTDSADTAACRSRAVALCGLALSVLTVATFAFTAVEDRGHGQSVPGPSTGRQAEHAAEAAGGDEVSPTPLPVSEERLALLPQADTFTEVVGAPRDPSLDQLPDGMVAHPTRTIAAYVSPGGEPVAAVPSTQPLGIEPARTRVATWLPVLERRPGWILVALPSRPNNSVAWLHLGPETTLATIPYLITVDRATFTMALHRDGREIGRWKVGIGAANSVTPAGRTFVIAVVHDPAATYTPVLLALGSHSDTYTTYGGGPGTVGVHGWPDPAVFGTAGSDGCIRVPADALHALTTTYNGSPIPAGTPVIIR